MSYPAMTQEQAVAELKRLWKQVEELEASSFFSERYHSKLLKRARELGKIIEPNFNMVEYSGEDSNRFDSGLCQ